MLCITPHIASAEPSIMLAVFSTRRCFGDRRSGRGRDGCGDRPDNKGPQHSGRDEYLAGNTFLSPYSGRRCDAGSVRGERSPDLKACTADKLVIGNELDVPKASAKAVTNDAQIAVPLEGLIDFDKERERLSNQIEKLTEEKERLATQLSNSNFVERAPAEKVEALRERLAELENQIGTLNYNLEALN